MVNARSVREIMRLTLITLLVGGLLALAGPVPKAWAPTAVEYAVIAIDAKTGLLTAADPSTGTTYRFQVKDKAALGTLKVGQKVEAEFTKLKPGAQGTLKLAGSGRVGIIAILIGMRPAAPARSNVGSRAANPCGNMPVGGAGR